MNISIDWLSISFPVLTHEYGYEQWGLSLLRAVSDFFGQKIGTWIMAGDWQAREKGRAPYTIAWERKEAGMSLFSGENLNHATIELSGQGCDFAEREGFLRRLLETGGHRCTRIDIANDIDCTTDPRAFASARRGERFKTTTEIVSTAGVTCYVGSQKSEKFARVYRYAAPHPRERLLRIEYVFRRDYAKKVVAEILNHSLSAVSTRAGIDFGWAHFAYDLHGDAAPSLAVQRPERDIGNTERWLVASAAPAFKRLVGQGVIQDPEAWVKQHFLA